MIRFQVFFVFGALQAVYACIRSIKLQSLKPKEIFFIKVETHPRLPKTPHLNTPPHIYSTVLDNLHNTAQMFTQRKKV